MMRASTTATVAGLAATGFAAAVATATYRPDRRPGERADPPPAGLRDKVAATLRDAVRLETVSSPDPDAIDPGPFEALHRLLSEQFPLLHRELELTPVGRHGLLFRWEGDGADDPLVLMAHQDVVPVDRDAPWTHPPFAGEIVDGMLWGRGTLDDKGSLIAICEAVERLLARGHRPARDVYLLFGANEEVGGDCAAAAARELTGRGVTPWCVVDEGGALASGAFPGVSAPVAAIGIAEKGTTNVVLRTRGPGGHSSTPARWDTTARLARAIVRLEEHPFPARMPGPTLEMVDRLGRHAAPPLRTVFAATRRAPRLLQAAFDRLGPETAAMVRTTMAVTQLSGAPGPNVLPSTASAVVNLRIMMGDSVDGCVEHIRRVIDDDSVEIDVVMRTEPSPVSATSGPAWEHLTRVTAEVFPDAVCAPYVMMGGTDARFLTHLTPNVYRFAPFRMSTAQRESLHSVDERIALDALAEGVLFYERLIAELPG